MTNGKNPVFLNAHGNQYTYVLQDEPLQQVEVSVPPASGPSLGMDDRIHSKITFPPGTVLSRVGVTMTPRSPSLTDVSLNKHKSDGTVAATPSGRSVKIFERLHLLPIYAFTLILTIFLVVLYIDLRNVRAELKALQNLVEERSSGHSPSSAELKYGGSNGMTTLPATSSTERDKREIEVDTAGYPLLAHYKGGAPEANVDVGDRGLSDGNIDCPGLIYPWLTDRVAEGEFALKNPVKEGQGSVEVTESGLYFVYAQVFYRTSNEANSYSIIVKDEVNRALTLATCSTPGNETGETSCYTASARFLSKGERLQLRQHERHRPVQFRQGQTFLGMVLLRPSL